MPRGFAWLRYLGILLGMALGNEGLEVWPLTRSEECAITGFLRDKLQYRNRLQYMKHYFPINYRVSVPYEGVLRVANVTRLQRARVSQQELRYLWVLVSLSATEWVQEVLLEGHPSWKYLEEVHTLLLDVKQDLPACGILAPQPGIEPAPTALEGEVLTTGPPGKSLNQLLTSSFSQCYWLMARSMCAQHLWGSGSSL
nr:interleukin-34 isoform X3 [Kogia breviceps]